MPWALTDIFGILPVFALVLFRISGLLMTAPVLGSRMIPLRIRAALAMTLAFMILPVAFTRAPAEITLSDALSGGATELMIGAAIGLALAITMLAAEVAGELVGQQAGLALGEIIDPANGSQTSVINQVYAISFVVAFLVVGGHRATVAAFLDTYHTIPILSFRPDESLVLLLVEVLAAGFMLGVRLAAPVLIALFLTGIALALLSRTMPQLNILTVGFSVRTMLTLATAGLALSVCENTMAEAIENAIEAVRATLNIAVSDNPGVP